MTFDFKYGILFYCPLFDSRRGTYRGAENARTEIRDCKTWHHIARDDDDDDEGWKTQDCDFTNVQLF